MRATAPRRTRHEELSDAELLRHLLMQGRVRQVPSLLRGGLMSLHWADSAELEGLSQLARKKVRAARFLACRFAGQAVGAAAVAIDPEPVVCFLFLEHSKPAAEVRGLLFLDSKGRGLGSYTLDRPCRRRPMDELREVLRAAVSVGARFLLLFHLRPGGEPDATGAEEELAETLRQPARVLGMDIAANWIVTGPMAWRSLGRWPASLPRTPIAGAGHFVGSRPVSLKEVGERLDALLYPGEPGEEELPEPPPEAPQVRELTRTVHSLRRLARTPPDALDVAGLSPRANQALAAALELTRRLGRAEVSPRPVTGGPECLAREHLPALRRSSEEQAWIVALDEHHRTRWRQHVPDTTRKNAADLARLVLEVALKHRAARLQPLHFLPNGGPSHGAWAEGLAPDVPELLAAIGVQWTDTIVLGADGSWSGLGQKGKLS